LRLASWTRRGFDTVTTNADTVFRRLADPLQGGDILLLHDGNAARGRSGQPVILEVLPRLLDAIAAKQLRPVTLRSAIPLMKPCWSRNSPPPAASAPVWRQRLQNLIGQHSGLRTLQVRNGGPRHPCRRGAGRRRRAAAGKSAQFRMPQQPAGRVGPAAGRFFQAVQQAAERWGRRRVGVFLGTSTAGILQTELAYRARDPVSGALPSSFEYGTTHNSFSVADYVRQRCRLEGPAVRDLLRLRVQRQAFGSARRMIEAGLIDAALVGGVDSLCLTTLYGFHSLQLTSPAPCRPFDVARDGISIGEAAAFALLERTPETTDADAPCCCWVSANPAMPTICRRRIPRDWGRAAPCKPHCKPQASSRGHRLHQLAWHRYSEQ
jgi:hypothetical protein